MPIMDIKTLTHAEYFFFNLVWNEMEKGVCYVLPVIKLKQSPNVHTLVRITGIAVFSP